MKRILAVLLSAMLLVCCSACGQETKYTEEEQTIIDGLYYLQSEGASIQQMYDESEAMSEAMADLTEATYNACKREYDEAMYLLKEETNVVIPYDLPETLPDFQR